MLERNLRTFVAVVDSGAMVLAARQLSYSAPAVTQHINSLERSLGIRLVHRDHAGVTLTEAGSVILPVARSIVQLSDAVEELAALFVARPGPARFGLSPGFSGAVIEPVRRGVSRP